MTRVTSFLLKSSQEIILTISTPELCFKMFMKKRKNVLLLMMLILLKPKRQVKAKIMFWNKNLIIQLAII